MELSVVITVFNEEDNIKPLLERIDDALKGFMHEVIFVDDGSTDDTVNKIKAYANEHVRVVVFNKNYGQTTALAAGIDYSTGDYVATMDGDLQNDPSDIPMMLDKLKKEGWDVVAGNRKNRQDGALLRKAPSLIANALIRKLTGVYIKDYGCSLRIYKKEYAKNLDLYGELHRFIPVLASLQGAKITQVDVKHHPRVHGTSKYGLGRTSKVISDLILIIFFQKYFRRPIHLFGPIGIFCFVMGALINLYLLIVKLLGNEIGGRPLLMLGITLVLAGIQFVTFGLIAELMMRIYFESQRKKPYRVKEFYIGKEESPEVRETLN